MGNDVGDINNDGLLDVIVLDMLPDKEKIRKQSGGEDDYELFEIKLKFRILLPVCEEYASTQSWWRAV